MPKQPLKAGARAAILEQGPSPGDDETRINERIGRIESEAWPAGFLTDVKSVTYSGGKIVILYVLEEDPSFRPPM